MNVKEFNFNDLEPTNNDNNIDFNAPFQQGFNNVFGVNETNTPTQNQQVTNTPEQPKNTPTYTEKDITESRSAGYEEGYAKGYHTAKGDLEEQSKQIENIIKNIDEKLLQLSQKNIEHDTNTSKELTKLSIKLAKSIYKHTAVNNTDDIVDTINKSLKILLEERNIVIYVHETMLDKIKNKLNNLQKQNNFKGTIELSSRNNLDTNDCIIEWQGGGLINSPAQAWKNLDTLFDNLFPTKQ